MTFSNNYELIEN